MLNPNPSINSNAQKHAPSYYAHSAHASPERPPLQGSVEADVCIVGAGYTGLSAGIALAEAGLKVVILEQARVGWGASGRNAEKILLIQPNAIVITKMTMLTTPWLSFDHLPACERRLVNTVSI